MRNFDPGDLPVSVEKLFAAVRKVEITDENIALVNRYLDQGWDINVHSESFDLYFRGKTPLIVAVEANGRIANRDDEGPAMVRLLLENGADVNKGKQVRVEGFGETPLFVAAKNGYGVIVEELIRRGADPSVKVGGKTPLEIAKENGHGDVIKYFEGEKSEGAEVPGGGGAVAGGAQAGAAPPIAESQAGAAPPIAEPQAGEAPPPKEPGVRLAAGGGKPLAGEGKGHGK